jgi:arabinoxylan arabinofuranohydrolase
MYVYPVGPRAYVKVVGVDFGARGPRTFKANVASAGPGGHLDVRAGSPQGALVATVDVPATGGPDVWKELTVPASAVTGVQDVYFVFNAGGRHVGFNVDCWQFE